jgi:cbb3-type cytochrome oxidase subunit 3
MAWKELFSTDIGLLSLFTIAFMIVMVGYLYYYARRHIAEDERSSRN